MTYVLHVLEALNNYGTEVFILNVLRNTDRSKIRFDFLVSRLTGSVVEEEIKTYGSSIFTYIPRKQGFGRHVNSLHSFFKEHAGKYNAIHIHGNSFTGMMPLAIANKYQIPIRIAHSHNTSTSGFHNKVLHYLNRLRIARIANQYFACSEGAKDWGFKNTSAYRDAMVVPNGIELNKFSFNPETRVRLREELNLGNDLIIGNVAAFRDVKNHKFMIEIMAEVVKTNPNTRLLFVGDGPSVENMREYARSLGVSDRVIFLGHRTDIPELLQAIDIFLFPSKYEGLGISLIEAQAAGLPVIASSVIPRETNVTPLIKYLSLSLPSSEWAKVIVESRLPDRTINYPGLSKFDISETCKILESAYTANKTS